MSKSVLKNKDIQKLSKSTGVPKVLENSQLHSSFISNNYEDINEIEYIVFKDKFPFEKRKKWVDEALVKYPYKIPIIIEQTNIHPFSGNFLWSKPLVYKIPQIPNPKFLMPKKIQVSEIQTIIKDKLHLNAFENIVVIASSKILKPDTELDSLYAKYKSEDGFLYLQYMKEETYG